MGRNPLSEILADAWKKDYEDSKSALDELGILSLVGRHMNELSGGGKEAVLSGKGPGSQKAEWMILDEPESGLDFAKRHEFSGS